MKNLKNTSIICHVSSWNNEEHCLVCNDYERSFSCNMTIHDLQRLANEMLSMWENGIAKIYYGKYQVGTSTRRYNGFVKEYLTNFGKKLCGQPSDQNEIDDINFNRVL